MATLTEISKHLRREGVGHVVVTAATAVETTPEHEAALKLFMDKLQRLITAYNIKQGLKHVGEIEIVREPGQRYDRILKNEKNSKVGTQIYCFVDRGTGDILKPASYKTPAKGARGNIHDESNGMKRMGPYGPAYNK